jgi:hypothetical protein
MADSMEMTILSILSPALHCEWNISKYVFIHFYTINTRVRSVTKVRDTAARVKKLGWTHSEKNGWQMNARNTGMVSERM